MSQPSTPACLLKANLKDVKDYLILQRRELLEAVKKQNSRLTEAQLKSLETEITKELNTAIESVEELESIQSQITSFWSLLRFGRR